MIKKSALARHGASATADEALAHYGALAVVAAALFIFVYNISPTVYIGDSGELIAASANLGVAHPPGYPVFVIISSALSKIFPFGNIAYRMNFVNALFVVFSILLMSRFAKAPLLVYFLLTPVALSSALAAEVFTLNLLFACAIIWLMHSSSKKNAMAAAFLFGLGLANQQTLILLTPGIIYLLAARKMFNARFATFLLASALAGFSANLFLLLRAQGGALFNWGDPSSLERFIDVLLRRDYGTFALHGSHHQMSLKTLLDYPRLGFIFSGPLFFLVPLAYFINFRKVSHFAHFLFISFLVSGPVFFIAAGLSSASGAFVEAITERFFLLPSAILIILAGILWPFLPRKKICAAALGIFSLFFLFQVKGQSLRHFYSLSDFANSVIRAVPKGNALVIERGAVGDDLIFALAYKKYAEKITMPDVYSAYGAIFPSVYGEDFRKQSPARRYASKMSFMLSGQEKSFFAFAKSQIPLPDYAFDGLLWSRADKFPGDNADFFWRLADLKSYRLRSLEVLYYYFRLLKNPSPEAAALCAFMGRDIDWLLTNMGPVWTALGRSDEARRSYEKAISINPSLPEAWNNLGVLDFNEGNYEAAARSFAESAYLTPDDVRYYNMGLAFSKLGRPEAARSAFEKCLSINPFNFGALNELGLIELRAGNNAAAKSFFQRGLSINPDDENLKYNLALANNMGTVR